MKRKLFFMGVLSMVLAFGLTLMGCASVPEGAQLLSDPQAELVGKTFVTADVTMKGLLGTGTWPCVLEVDPATGSIKRGEMAANYGTGVRLSPGKVSWQAFKLNQPGVITNVSDVTSFNQGKVELANILE